LARDFPPLRGAPQRNSIAADFVGSQNAETPVNGE
jgi:hypothetical protein